MLRRTIYRLGQMVMRAYAYLLLDMDIHLEAPLPPGPKILAANHPTTLDPFLLLTVTSEEVNILVTEFCFALPIFGRYLRGAGHISVKHGHGCQAFDAAVQQLTEGQSIGIFPEGVLSPIAGGLCRSHTGMTRLALMTHVPIIPIGSAVQRERLHFCEIQAGSLKETARWYFSGKYAMTIGAPVFLKGDVNDRALVRALTDQLTLRLAELADQSLARLPSAAISNVFAPMS